MICLQMSWFLIDLGGARAEVASDGRGVVVGRDPAGGGQGAAPGSGGAGPAALRPGAAFADRGAVGAAAGRGGTAGGTGTADDRDGDLRALDDRQASLRVGVRDSRAGSLRLAAPAPLLSDRDDRAGAGRVDGPRADPPTWGGGRARDHARADLKGQAGEAVQASRGADRLDRRGSRREVSDRRGGWQTVA